MQIQVGTGQFVCKDTDTHLLAAPSANTAKWNDPKERMKMAMVTYIVDDVRLDVLFSRSFRVHRTDDVDLVVLVGNIASINVNNVICVIDAKPK